MIRKFVYAATATLMAVFLMAAMPRSAFAQAAEGAAGGASGSGVICKDGSTWAKPGRGACRGHGGVDKARTRAAAGATNDHSNGQGAAGATSAPAAGAPAASGSERTRTESAPVAGGGAGQVWVNTSSKVYHCPGTRWYGKTKQGKYMSESEARAEGARPDHGKGCT